MGKMGLLGGDFSGSVKSNELARLIMSRKGVVGCGFYEASRSIPAYLLAEGEDRAELAYQLGGQRVICGIKQAQQGEVERGVYTLVKGLYYLGEYYRNLRKLVEMDANNCQQGHVDDYSDWIEGYLLATEGRPQEIVLEAYKQVENERARVYELCPY